MRTAGSNPGGIGIGPLFLGIEGGGTRTVAIWADAQGTPGRRLEAGAANLRLISDAQLRFQLRSLAGQLPSPAAVAIGLAGASTESDRARIRAAAAKVWPGTPCLATNDLETALAAAATSSAKPPRVRVLVLSGTGSCCYGRAADGRTAKAGGWGHLLGDRGSAYEIALNALKRVLWAFDRSGAWPQLGQRLLRVLLLNEPDQLTAWIQSASKTDIAALAVEVFAAWKNHDKMAAEILAEAAERLAVDAVACARRLARKAEAVQFVFAGGTLLKQPRFAQRTGREVRRLWPRARILLLQREGAWGAVALAKQMLAGLDLQGSSGESGGFSGGIGGAPLSAFRTRNSLKAGQRTGRTVPALAATQNAARLPPPSRLTSPASISPTEQRNPRSMKLDRMPLDRAIRLMLSEEAKVPAAILAERRKIERALRLIVHAFKRGGRLFYVGAGTSGRLGVLDASECPPTFGTPPDQVQGIIAGGQRALWQAIEGAEDDGEAGADAIRFRAVGARDVVVGIAASGRTPFVWGALRQAKRSGAATVLLCFNPTMAIARANQPTVAIAPAIGPEVLTGSTRLKAGTATKIILNLFTTLAMVRLGKVIGNLMVDVHPSNTKLRLRAVRMVQTLTGVKAEAAEKALVRSGWIVKKACQRLRR
jgi:N-acetylmuramic acid 6-phosphate etherase